MESVKLGHRTSTRDDLDVNRDVIVKLRLTAAERDAWDAAAKKAGLKLSEWIRRRCQVSEAPAPAAVVKAKKARRS